jgi:hypothetical protein
MEDGAEAFQQKTSHTRTKMTKFVCFAQSDGSGKFSPDIFRLFCDSICSLETDGVVYIGSLYRNGELLHLREGRDVPQ